MKTVILTDTECAVLAYMLEEAWGEALKDFDFETYPDGEEALEALAEKFPAPIYEDDEEEDEEDEEDEDDEEDEEDED